MSVLKQIKFGSTSTPIAKSVVAINSESTKALSVVATNDQLTDNADPTYTIALAVDGKTITKTGNDGLATALQLKYHAAVTEGTPKGAYIALEDNTGASISGSEIPVADIIGNGMLKSASYSETTGVLTLTFATASGTDTTVQIDLGKLFDIDDIIINSTDGSANYLSFDLANPAAETGQAVLSVKLADVTYTPTSGGTPADLTVNTTNGKMLAADDAIPAIKQYVDAKTTDLAVKAQGDAYVAASVDANDNKKVVVATNKQDLTATAGTPGVYGDDGSQTTAPTAGTLSGTANSLADAADIAAKVKTYVDGAIAIEAARSDAKNKADIAALDVTTDAAVAGQYVAAIEETDGVVAVKTRANVSEAVLNKYAKGTVGTAVAATDTINEAFSKIEVRIDNNEQVTSAALNNIKAKIDGMDKAAAAVDGQVVTTVSEADGVVSETKANVKDLQLGGYAKDASAKSPIGGTDTINTALSKLENAIDAAKAAATTKVVEGTDAGNNLKISSATSETDGSTTYTINLTDVASKTALDAEIAARKAVDGQDGQTYAANANANYISAATSLNDADVKLDAALKAEETRAKSAETAIDGAVGLTKDASGEGRTYTNTGEYIGKETSNTVASDIKALDTQLKAVTDKVNAIQYKVTGTTLEFFEISEKTGA